jgi:hypothetical protein
VRITEDLDNDQQRMAKLVYGHHEYGIHRVLHGKTAYFTFLRNPIERVVSLYRFIQRYPEHHLHDTLQGRDIDIGLREVIAKRTSLEFENGQTRMLSGLVKESDANRLFEESVRNIAERFCLVGTVERFDESLLLLARATRLRWLFYERRNAAPSRCKGPDAETVKAIRAANAADIRLYEWACGKLAQEIDAAAPWLERSKSRLHLNCSIYKRVTNTGRLLRKAVSVRRGIGHALRPDVKG